MTDFAFEIAELKRRMDNMIRGGTIVEMDYMAEPPRAKIKDGEQVLGWMHFMTMRANGQEISWDAPEVGERVMAISPSGDLANARIIPGALYCNAHPAPTVNPDVITRMHKDGAHDTYDREAHVRTIQIPEEGELKVVVGDTLVSVRGQHVMIKSSNITLDGDEILLDGSASVTLKSPMIILDGETHLGGAGGDPVARKGDDINTTTKKITKGSDNVFSN